MTGAPTPAIVAGNVFITQAELPGHPGLGMVVDTGAPAIVLRSAAAPDLVRENAINSVRSLKTLGIDVSGARVVGLDFFQGNVPLDGLIGCDLLCSFELGLDYKAKTIRLDGEAPAGTEAATPIAFQLKGGGLEVFAGIAEPVDLLPSRIVLPVEIEGTTHTMVLDTGAAYPVVTQALGQMLSADGRKVLETAALSMGGVTRNGMVRSKAMSVSGLSVEGTPVVFGQAFDALLDGVSKEVGQPIEGLLGGAYLRHFYASIGYLDSTLRLSRYAGGDGVVDELSRVGIDLSTSPTDPAGSRTVTFVHLGTDAKQKGLAPGDTVHAIDGVSVDAIHPLGLTTALGGPAGTTHELSVDCAACGAAAGKLRVAVDDLIPLN